MLIAALGGEGGGVLTDWIVSAAASAGFSGAERRRSPASRSAPAPPPTTSRFCRCRLAELGGKRPVLALTPGVGDIDVVVASELLEAGRAVANGFVTPERTHADRLDSAASIAMDEKIAMGDGRFDQDRLIKADQGICERRLACRHGRARKAERRRSSMR